MKRGGALFGLFEIRHPVSNSDKIILRRVAEVTIQVAEQPDDNKN